MRFFVSINYFLCISSFSFYHFFCWISFIFSFRFFIFTFFLLSFFFSFYSFFTLDFIFYCCLKSNVVLLNMDKARYESAPNKPSQSALERYCYCNTHMWWDSTEVERALRNLVLDSFAGSRVWTPLKAKRIEKSIRV